MKIFQDIKTDKRATGKFPLSRPKKISDIPAIFRHSPIEDLIAYQNIGKSFKHHSNPELLIVTCIDTRIQLKLPPNFAHVIRIGGAQAKSVEFQITYMIAIRNITAVAFVSHDDCAMVDLISKRKNFVDSLVKGNSWTAHTAEAYFDSHQPTHDVGHPLEMVCSQASVVAEKFPKVVVAALFYTVTNNNISIISYRKRK